MPRVEAEVGSAANSYEILAKLATGGMAEIFLARGASTAGVERYVVLKRILRNKANDQAFVRMFLDEARLAAQLQHPNIAQVYDIGKLGDSYFFTMEYVHGETVRTLLQRSHALRSPIPIGSVLVVAAGAAAGLHHAHERNGLDGKPLGIVHRDVSPSNLMASYEGGVKVVDFGVAKAAHRDQETKSGTVKGKISYLSPEQCRGNPIDRRSDLFSLGIVMWEMLTTERLYKRNSDFEAMAAIVSEPVPPPSTRRPDIPRELDALVLQLLAKDPNDRYQTADQLHEALESIAVRLGSALSSAALARYLRDVFGQRPEPWIEMQSREDHPEVFTVTSEPIPVDLAVRPADKLESQLGAVPDLSPDDGSESDASEQPAPQLASLTPMNDPFARPTLPFKRQPGQSDPPPIQALLATHIGTGVANPPQRNTPGLTGPQQPIIAVPGSGPQQVPVTGPMPMPMPRSNTSGGAPAYVPRDISGPNQPPPPSYSGQYPLYQRPPVEPDRDEKKGMPRALVILLGAVTIGIIVGVIMAVSGGSHHKSVGTKDASVVVMTTQDAAVAVVEAPPVVIDAAPVAVVETKKAPPPDAAQADEAKVEIDKPAQPSPAEKLAQQLDQGDYQGAVATCVANASLVGAVPASCAIAACRAHDARNAKKWYAGAGSKKPTVVNACKAGGIELEKAAASSTTTKDKDKDSKDTSTGTKSSKDKDCASGDPMACQH
ncbi:MAG: protein kinase [Kofleriaceae bacterium]